MIGLSLGRLRDATGAELVPAQDDQREPAGLVGLADVIVDGVVTTDSRECGPGSLFVARRGEHADGHDFVPAAVAAGAVAVLGERPVEGVPALVSPDVQTAFGRVARAVVDSAPHLRVVGITGSSGKTGVKDLLAAVLATTAETVAPLHSFNGEIGVPLTVCRVTEATRFLVAEMGARGIGHLEYLTEIAPPQVAVVLNVGHAHMGEFGSVANIARAKSELPRALTADGLAVLNRDDPNVAAMADGLRSRVLLVGEHEDSDLRATSVQLDSRGRATYTLLRADRDDSGRAAATVRLAQPGRHWVGNSLSVIAVALEFGVPLDHILEVLATAGPTSRWRMEITDRADGVTVVNDAYNANPDSMAAALAAVTAMAVDGRRVAVLGGMLELGATSADQHREVGADAAERGIDILVGVGELAHDLVAGYDAAGGERSHWVRDSDEAHELLDRLLGSGDLVVLKSSRDAGLRWLGDRLAGVGADRVVPGQ